MKCYDTGNGQITLESAEFIVYPYSYFSLEKRLWSYDHVGETIEGEWRWVAYRKYGGGGLRKVGEGETAFSVLDSLPTAP